MSGGDSKHENTKGHESTKFFIVRVRKLIISRVTAAISVSLVCAVLMATAGLAASTALPTSQQIVSLLQKNYKGLKDYKADAVLTMKSQQINVTGLCMTVYYKHPGKVHIDAKDGFAMLPRDVHFGNPGEDLVKQFNIQVLSMDKSGSRDTAVVMLTPKSQSPGSSHSLKAWIDTDRGLLLSTLGNDPSGSSFKSTWTYTRVVGKHWLPSEIKAEMKMSTQSNSDPTDPDDRGPRSHRPRIGQGTMSVKFKNYKINQGIPDSVFKEPAKRR